MTEKWDDSKLLAFWMCAVFIVTMLLYNEFMTDDKVFAFKKQCIEKHGAVVMNMDNHYECITGNFNREAL